MNVYPFNLRNATTLFRPYVAAHRDELNEKYGHYCYTGNAERDRKKTWSYYEVDAKIVSATCIIFTTYGMQSFAYGGRGFEQEQITWDNAGAAALAPFIEARRQKVATDVYIARQVAEAARVEAAAIKAFYEELFSC